MTNKEKATILAMYEKTCATLDARREECAANLGNKSIEKLIVFSIGKKCGLEDMMKELNISI